MIRVLALGLLWATVVFAAPASEEGWKQISDEDGITVWSKDIEGTDLVAFRGEAVMAAPIAKLAAVLSDSSRKTEWVADCTVAEDLEIISPLERIEYSRISTPWPLQDRDFVFRVKVDVNRAAKQMTIRFASVEDHRAPNPEGRVRGKIIKSIYTLTSIEGGTKTRLRIEIHADPAGSIPKWLVNSAQRNWPKTTLTRIQEQVAKPDVVEHAFVKAYFNSAITEEAARAWINGGWKKPGAEDQLRSSMSAPVH